MARRTRTFQLTSELLSQHCGGQVLCLDRHAEGRSYHLHAERPTAELNEIVGGGVIVDPAQHQEPIGPVLVRVDVRGVIEQRAGYHDYCGGWSDGHDSIADRMVEALELGDVVMVFDSPGGAHAGLEEAVRRVLDAKTEHGRRVYAFADEMIGSAAYWWAAAIADEIYVPPSGIVGSVGARSCHVSVAEHLAKEGVAFTYFAWPGEGKVAFAQEKPLSELGRARGERDVALAGEAFAAAVEAGRGLTRDAIVALDADCLAGEAAVSAGLADGTASLEDVIEHALAVASGEETMAIKQTASESYERTTKERYESDDPEPTSEGEDEEEPEPDAEGEEPEPDAEAEPDPEAEGDEPMPEEEGDEPEPEDEDDEEPVQAKRTSARTTSRGTSLAEIVGLRPGASQLAINTQVRRMRSTLGHLMTEFDASNLDELVGNAKAVAQDAARMAQVEATNRKLVKQHRAERRMAAARKLVAASLPGLTRGDLFIDTVDAKGKRGLKLAPEYQQMKLETFEGFVNRKLKSGGAPVRRATPFDASREAAAEAAAAPNLEAARKHPAVIKAAQRSGGDIDVYARAFVAQFATNAGDPAI